MDRTRDIRREYAYAKLSKADLAEQPLDQFESWLDHAPVSYTHLTLPTKA